MLGSELLLKCLEEQQVEYVFGLPGGAVIPLYDVLGKSNIKHILTRHEQGAVHAADGYARSSGKVGVCFATSGPGATNLLTGLATAHMDSVPVVAITGQVAKGFLGKDSFQEADTVGISQAITKHNYLVKDANDIPNIIAEAFYIATNGRPGPVLIDIPKDVFTQKVNAKKGQVRQRVKAKFAKPKINREQITKAVAILKNAKQPLIFVGGGLNNTEKGWEYLQEVALKHEIPVAVTLMGKGTFPGDDPLYLGMVGMHGTVQANWAMQNCDCLLAIGVRFDDRVTGNLENFAPEAKIIHVDIDACEIGKNVAAHIPVVADGEEFLQVINEKLWATKNTKDWLNKIHLKVCKEKPISTGLHPQLVLETLNELVDKDTIIVTDVGQHQMWAALFVDTHKPRSFITSGGLGTMGFGLPAAIGAQFANPDKKVVLITGDGSLQMNLQELAVIKKWQLPIKIMLINNGYLGMVRQWQELFCNENYAETSLDVGPEWGKLAEAYGIKNFTVRNFAENEEILNKQLIKNNQSYLLDFHVDSDANVFPMVPAGSSLDEIWGRNENEAHVSSLG